MFFILTKSVSNSIQYADFLSTLNIWISILSFIIVLVFGVNLYQSWKAKSELEESIKEYKSMIDIQSTKVANLEDQLNIVSVKLDKDSRYNNQLVLAIMNMGKFGNYPEAFLNEFPDDLLSNQIYGKTIFSQCNNFWVKDINELNKNIAKIRKGLECYIFITHNGYYEKIRQYGLGDTFGESIVHEIMGFANLLMYIDKANSTVTDENVTLINKCFDAILLSLNFKDENEMKMLDYTDVFRMSYCALLFDFGIYLSNNRESSILFLEKYVNFELHNIILAAQIKENINKALDILINYYHFDTEKLSLYKNIKNHLIGM